MTKIILRHRVFAVFLFSLLWLAASTWAYAIAANRVQGNVALLLLLLASTVLTYALAWRLARWLRIAWATEPPSVDAKIGGAHRAFLAALVCAYAAVPVAHFLLLGFVPVIEALRSSSDIAVSVIRQRGYFELPGFMRYASDYSVKAIGPALLLITYYFRSRLFWVVLAVGVFYSTALFARILPIVLFLPLLIFMLMKRRWLHIGAVLMVMCAQLVLLTAVSSTSIRTALMPTFGESELAGERPYGPQSQEQVFQPRQGLLAPLPPPEDWRRTSVVYAFYSRMVLVPGEVIDQWFQYYREPEQRERGCGYRTLAPLIGCSYVPIPSKLYSAFYPENVSQGMRGSLNAAFFMTEYANFGPSGFLIAGLLAGGLFALIMVVYRDHPLALPMNVPLIITIMESSLPTAVNSGSGWLVITAIFVLFFRQVRK